VPDGRECGEPAGNFLSTAETFETSRGIFARSAASHARRPEPLWQGRESAGDRDGRGWIKTKGFTMDGEVGAIGPDGSSKGQFGLR
jgi:hypothetical protein